MNGPPPAVTAGVVNPRRVGRARQGRTSSAMRISASRKRPSPPRSTASAPRGVHTRCSPQGSASERLVARKKAFGSALLRPNKMTGQMEAEWHARGWKVHLVLDFGGRDRFTAGHARIPGAAAPSPRPTRLAGEFTNRDHVADTRPNE